MGIQEQQKRIAAANLCIINEQTIVMMITEPADPSALCEARMCGRKTEKHCSFKYDFFFRFVGHCAQVTKGMGKDIHSEIYHGKREVVIFFINRRLQRAQRVERIGHTSDKNDILWKAISDRLYRQDITF